MASSRTIARDGRAGWTLMTAAPTRLLCRAIWLPRHTRNTAPL